MDIHAFWDAVLRQDAEAIRAFFAKDAVIRWHCSNERFTVEEFIRANCEYPGVWTGQVERVCRTDEGLVTAVRVENAQDGVSFHVASFFCLKAGRIVALDEYWGDDGPAPQWRGQLGIGAPIRFS